MGRAGHNAGVIECRFCAILAVAMVPYCFHYAPLFSMLCHGSLLDIVDSKHTALPC